MKLGLVAASLILVAGGAVGCGDNGGGGLTGNNAPSTKEFCGALEDFRDGFSESDPTNDPEGYIKALKDAADKLEDVGTPDNMPDDAKDGLELTLEKLKDIDDDATLEDLSELGEVSDEDQKKIDALDKYIDEECPELSEEGS